MDKQLSVLLTIAITVWLAVILSLSYLLDEPKKVMTAEQYADKLCQELYGPQTGHKWVDASLMCETVRGEIIAVREPK